MIPAFQRLFGARLSLSSTKVRRQRFVQKWQRVVSSRRMVYWSCIQEIKSGKDGATACPVVLHGFQRGADGSGLAAVG